MSSNVCLEKKEKEMVLSGQSIKVLEYTYFCKEEYEAPKNTYLEAFELNDRLSSIKLEKYQRFVKEAWLSLGGWQSWSATAEIAPGKKQPKVQCSVIPQWNGYLAVPGEDNKFSANNAMGQFITYFRWGDYHFVMASTGNTESLCAPVYFRINKKTNMITVCICDQGKKWKAGEKMAKVVFFCADGYFAVKDTLSNLFYNKERFSSLDFLASTPGGWESWYNHYANIDEKLICEDLESLCKTENLMSSLYINENKPCVFQIDDGWENALGDWTWNNKFLSGPKVLTEKIEEKKLIPGLWIAPFIIDLRSPVAKAHPDWLLRDENGKLVDAGFNPLWGAKKGANQPSRNGTFFCLDLSRDDVVEYLDKVADTAVNEWGFRYIKYDFLYAGMFYGKFASGGTAYEWFDRALKTITKRKQNSKGKPVAYLGCGTPLELSFNDLPLSRIGCDTFEHWENKLAKAIGWNGRNSAVLNLRDTLGHAFWNKSIFYCDPDVIFVRKENCTLTEEEKLLIAKIAFMFGNQIMYSDDPAKCSSEEEKLLTKKIVQLQKEISKKEFGLKQIAEDVYEVFNRENSESYILNLKKRTFNYK